jgi:hypothetical protein
MGLSMAQDIVIIDRLVMVRFVQRHRRMKKNSTDIDILIALFVTRLEGQAHSPPGS